MHLYRKSCVSCFSLGMLGAMVAVAAMWSGGVARAQYESKEVQNMGRYGISAAKRYARSPSGGNEERTMFGRFLRDYYVPMMTQTDANSLANLSRMRYDLMRSFLWSAAPQVQSDVTQLMLNEMTDLVKGRYHPAVRYNAMLIIGQLDQTYGSQNTKPVPLPKANDFLNKYVSMGINAAQAPVPLIVGAMIGLERHAMVLDQLPAANRSATAGALLAVLEKEEFPHDISSSVQQWMKVIAARGLANVGALGDDNRVHKAMMSVIGNESSRLNNRVRVAELLEAYSAAYASATGIDERNTVQTLLQLASDIAADEKERAIKFEDEALRGGGVGNQFAFGNDVEMPDEYQVRRLLLRLNGLKTGITAVRPAVKDAKLAGLLDQVLAAVDPVLAAATDRNVITLNLTRDIKLMADAIAATSAALGVEAVEAPPESDEEAAERMLEEEAAEQEAPAAQPAA